jgi:putative peptidoglycan lipid II flippase
VVLNFPSKSSRLLLRDSASATVASVLGQAPSVLVAPMAAFLFGATANTDVVFLALAVANLLITTVSGATQFAVVPFLVESRVRGGTAADFLVPLTDRLALASAVLAVLVSVAGGFYISYAVPEYAHAAAYLWWLCPFVVLASVASLFVGALNAHRDYWLAAVSPGWRWVTVLASLLALGPRLGAVSLIIGYTLGEAMRVWSLARQVAVHEPDVHWLSHGLKPAPGLLPFVRSGAAQILGSGVLALAPVIDRQLAGTLPAGSISILEYADRLWQVPVGFAMSGVLVVILSKWSHDLAADRHPSEMARQTRRTAVRLGLAAVLPCLAVMALRRPLIALLFAHGSFPKDGLPILADTFGVYLAVVPMYLAGMAYSRAFLALRRSDWLLGVAIAEIALKIVLNGPMLHAFGLPGLAGATGLMYAAGLVLLAAGLHGRAARAAS